MKKSTKVWLGLATIWPAIYVVLFMASIFLIVAWAGLNSGPGSSPSNPPPVGMFFPVGFMGLMFVHMLTILGSLALTVFYVVRVFKTEGIDQNLKIMWTLLMFFAGMFAQPVFWYLYIWKEAPAGASQNEPRLVGAASQSSWSRQAAPERDAAYVPPQQPPDWR